MDVGERKKFRRNLFLWFIICVVVSLAIWARFIALHNREFFNFDETAFYYGANRAPLLKELVIRFNTVVLERSFFSDYMMGLWRGIFPEGIYLPVFNAISLLAAFFLGIKPETAFYMNAFFGILTLFVFFRLCARLYSVRTAYFAAFLMAFSPTHIFYSRSGLAISIPLFFIVVSFYFYVKSREGVSRSVVAILCSGLFLALAASSHPSFFVFFPIYFILEMFNVIAAPQKGRACFHAVLLFLPVLAVCILLELPYFLVHTYYAMKGEIPFFRNYYTSMVRLNNMGSMVVNFKGFHNTCSNHYYVQPKSPFDRVYFFIYLAAAEGIGFVFVVLSGFVFLLFRFIRGFNYKFLIPLVWVLFPVIFYNVAHLNMHIRPYICIMPALYIIIGYLFDFVLRYNKNKMLPVIFISLFFLFSIAYNVHGIGKIIKSGLNLKPIAAYIEEHKLDDIIVNSVAMYVDVEDHLLRNLPGFRINVQTEDDGHVSNAGVKSSRHFDKIVLRATWLEWPVIKRLYDEGFIRYLVTNLLNADYSFPPPGVLKGIRPLAYVDNPDFVYKPGLYDSKCYTEAQEYFDNDSLRYIALYDLRDVFSQSSDN